ncbi:MAG: DUF3796 domain-containing protein, partial [Clostridia bacterium]|nr:DUF3796 domain-containing protein [Clostridia bacterium]
MKKGKLRGMIAAGAVCALLLTAASLYSVFFNDSRLVEPMEAGFAATPKDLPMIIALAASGAYLLALFALLVRAIVRRRRAEAPVTRRLNPKLGYLGFLGLLGFGGFLTYRAAGEVFPFLFFAFFGFFGFFYEGKMSGTLKDERFRENAVRAQLTAYRAALGMIVVASILLCQGRLLGSLEHAFIALLIVIALSFAMAVFLNEYLLYRY